MFKKNRFFFLLLLAVFFFSADGLYAQSVKRLVKKARNYTLKGEIYKARETYLKAYAKDSSNYNVNCELGLLLTEYMDHTDEAGKYLVNAERLTKKDTLHELIYELGCYYQQRKQYDKALNYFHRMVRWIDDSPDGLEFQKELRNHISNCEYAQSNINVEERAGIKVENAGKSINSIYPEYVPVSTHNDSVILFTSRRPSKINNQIDDVDQQFYEDMYIARIEGESGVYGQATLFTGDEVSQIPNTKYHESVVSVTHDGQKLFTFKDGILYECVKKGNSWSSPKKLDQHINIDAYQNHASLSTDGKTMFFSTEERSGFGGRDIWMVKKDEKGEWGAAINLGGEINTVMDEEGAQISEDGKTLYFASNGRPGFGGFDLFKSTWDGSKWSIPENMGEPINSPANDVFLTINAEENHGFLSSSRTGGYGDMDIYRIFVADCSPYPNKTYTVTVDARASIDSIGKKVNYIWNFGDGTKAIGQKLDHTYIHPGFYKITVDVVDVETGTIEKNEEYKELDIKNVNHIGFRSLDTTYLGDTLVFDASCSMLKEEKIVSKKWFVNGEELIGQTADVFSKRITEKKNLDVKIEVKTDKNNSYCYFKTILVRDSADKPKEFTELVMGGADGITGTHTGEGVDTTGIGVLGFKLENIYFSFDKFNIRGDASKTLDENLLKLAKYTKAVIKISAHCDARGTNDYNKKLSVKRAESTIKYLEKHGFDRSRIVAVLTMGEEELVNKCGDDAQCSKAEHQKNRRVEFKIVSIK